ncbi:TIR domain-containing protein [bacterium]|nr:TIR domain-containing protein [bacterium]
MTTVFLSYARGDDEPFARRLHDDLEAAGLDVWFDRLDMPSRALTFLQEIRDAISARDRLVLVFGPSALTSEYVEAEWRWAFDFGKPVNPVLRLSDYADLPDELRLIDAPDFRDDAHYQERLETLVRQLSEPVPPMGKLVGVPSLPQHLLKRPDRLRALKDAVLADVRRTAVVTGEPARVGVHGMGGIGKSVLATMLARDTEVRWAFPDGVIWVPIGQSPNVAELQRLIAKALGDPGIFDNAGEGKAKLQKLLADRAVLLLLDDVWDANHLDFFDCLGPRCRMVITSRDASIITAIGGTEHQVQLLTEAEARDLLAEWAGLDVAALPEQAVAVMAHCGQLPLALSLCGAMVRDGASWDDLLEALAEADLEYLDHPHGSILRSIKLSVDRLPEDEAERFAELRVFPPDETVPEAAVLMLWAHTGGLSQRHARKLLTTLEQRALVRLDGVAPNRRVSLHDLVYDYMAQMVADEAALHGDLVEAYRAKCPEGWASGPNDGYFFEHLREHLKAAGRAEEILALCLDLWWLEAKTEAGLVFDLPRDLEAGQAALSLDDPVCKNLRLLEQALRNDLHFVARHPTTLFQCLWNSAWWYDCPDAAHYCAPPSAAGVSPPPPWERSEPKLCTLLERWREEKEQSQPGLAWLRSLRPPPQAIGGPQIACLGGSPRAMLSVAVSPRGMIAASSRDGMVWLWDSSVFAQVAVHHVHDAAVTSVTFSPDGRRFATGSEDDAVRVWDADSGAELLCLTGHQDWVQSVTFSQDGNWLASGSSDGTVRVWDSQTGAEVACLRGHRPWVNHVVFSPDGMQVASGSDDGTVRVWEACTGAEIACLQGHEGVVFDVAFSEDSSLLASGSTNGVRIWDTLSLTQAACLETHDRVSGLAFSPDGARLAGGSYDGTLHLWDTATWTEIARLRGHEEPVTSAVFLDSRRLVSASWDQTVRVWDVDAAVETTRTTTSPYLKHICFSPDGTLLLGVGEDGGACVLNWQDGRPVACVKCPEVVTNAAFSPDGARFGLTSWDQTLRVCSVLAPEEAGPVLSDDGPLRSIAFSRDGQRLATGSGRELTHENCTVRIWDAVDLEPIASNDGHTGPVIAVAFSPDGTGLASGSYDHTVRLWDASSGACVACLHGHEHWVQAVAFSPDGARLVSVALDGTTRVWDAGSYRCVEVIRGMGDAAAISGGARWWALSDGVETLVQSGAGRRVMGWWPRPFEEIVTHPSGRMWAGRLGSQCITLFALEGNPDTATLQGRADSTEVPALPWRTDT